MDQVPPFTRTLMSVLWHKNIKIHGFYNSILTCHEEVLHSSYSFINRSVMLTWQVFVYNFSFSLSKGKPFICESFIFTFTVRYLNSLWMQISEKKIAHLALQSCSVHIIPTSLLWSSSRQKQSKICWICLSLLYKWLIAFAYNVPTGKTYFYICRKTC